MIQYSLLDGLRKQVIFSKHQHWFSRKKKFLRNKQRDSILVMCYCQDLDGTSDWLKPIFSQSEAPPRSGGGGGVLLHQHGISVLVPWKSIDWETTLVASRKGWLLVIGQNTVLPHHYLLHQNLQTAAYSSSSFHRPPLFV